MFNILDKPENYTLSTCSGIIATPGRRGRGFVVESVHRDIHLSLPTLIECDHIPDNREEIPTPQVVLNDFHLHDLAGTIQPLDDSCQILLLIGRYLTVAHHVLDQKVGSERNPYAQQLKLGWVIVGETCLHREHKSSNVMSAFPSDDLATSLKDLDLQSDDKPCVRSLGLNWDLNSDNFLFRLSSDDKCHDN
jgi:hypothetical protein